MPSLVELLRETARRELTEDDKFYRKMLYFFELRVPFDVWPLGSFLFPLMVNPQSISFEEPFSVEVTQTQDGGVIVEENGIVVRRLHIRGNTGWKPRKMNSASAVTSLISIPPDKRSYDRQLPALILDAISGQRHFQYLQDAVFRTYADLKKDPESAKDTKLIFHNPKDDEHWEVVPQAFNLERSSGKPTMYDYSIDLLVVGKASAHEIDESEDKAWWDSLKDKLRQVNNAIQSIQGFVRDVTGVVSEIKGYIANIGTILTSAVQILDAVTDFVNGVTDAVLLVPTTVKNLVAEVETAIADYEDALERIGVDLDPEERTDPLPVQIHQAMTGLSTGCELLLMHPTIFETPLDQQLRLLKNRQSLSDVASAEELDAAAAESSPTSLTDITNKGTALMPGDSNRAEVNITGAGANVPVYSSLTETIVEQGDTLMTIAAKALGDARKWQELAVVNNLRPPFINGQAASDIEEATDQEALPGALGVGKKLLVPGRKKPPELQPRLPVLGVPTDASIEQRLLGGDLALIRYPGTQPRYDVAIDVAHGSVDAKKVIGMDCLRQAIELRLVIEKGTDILFKRVGIEQVVGLRWAPLDKELLRYRVLKTVQEDPRIAGVRKATLTAPTDDSAEVEVEAVVVGFAQPATVKVVV